MGSAVNFSIRPAVDGLLARLLPARCLLCDGPGLPGHDLCEGCEAGLPWQGAACPTCAMPQEPIGGHARARGYARARSRGRPNTPAVASGAVVGNVPGELSCRQCQRDPSPLHGVHAAFLYVEPVSQLLPRLKFHGGLSSARLLSRLMSEPARDWPRPDALLPVPLHASRLRERGYDQALELARPLARHLGLPLCTQALRRVRATVPQSTLDAATRRENLRDAFATTGTALPAHVALFDDVMTTGATLHAAARALRRAGVERVDAWVCARAP